MHECLKKLLLYYYFYHHQYYHYYYIIIVIIIIIVVIIIIIISCDYCYYYNFRVSIVSRGSIPWQKHPIPPTRPPGTRTDNRPFTR